MEYERFADAEADDLAAFLCHEPWPFHGQPTLDDRTVRRGLDHGDYSGPSNTTFWMVLEAKHVGIITLQDVGDQTPMFDLRISEPYRGHGHGTAAVRWLTTHLFVSQDQADRVEAVTRQDNRAMRAALRTAGYVKEAHYRLAWRTDDGAVHDAVGYAVTRADWQAGTVTSPNWYDDPADHPS